MARFLTESDYASQIKQDIIRLLTDQDWFNSAKLITAEQKATAQIKQRIGARYNCNTLFSATGEARDMWIVTILIDITLYHLYSQSGSKDVPEHRSSRYQDAIDWLKDVSAGTTIADLPAVIDATTGDTYSEFILNSRTPENHKW